MVHQAFGETLAPVLRECEQRVDADRFVVCEGLYTSGDFVRLADEIEIVARVG